MCPWEGIISEEEIRRYEAAGFGERPGLAIIDVQYRTVGTTRKPFWEAIGEFKASCGEHAWRAVDHLVPLLALFRERGWPVFYPHVAPKEAFDYGRLSEHAVNLFDMAYKYADVRPVDQVIEMLRGVNRPGAAAD